MSIFGTIANDVRDVEARFRDFVDQHAATFDRVATTLEGLQNDPIVQALERAAGLPADARKLIADLIDKLAATQPTSGPVGIDAQPDPAPAPQQPAQAGAQA